MSLKILLSLLLFSVACASTKPVTVTPPIPAKEFAPGELILATQLLTKIFDKEMAPLSCVADTSEAALLLRTIRPRIEVVQDDMEALLDIPTEVARMIQDCDKNCTCSHVDEILREHQVTISKASRKILNQKNSEKEVNRCLNYIQSTFCQSDLYRQLNLEKLDFSFKEEVP